jgi:hypothetical protein
MAKPLRMAPPPMMTAPMAVAAAGVRRIVPAATAVPAAAMVISWPVTVLRAQAARARVMQTLGFIVESEI